MRSVKKRRVLVTGATGFLGSFLLTNLQQSGYDTVTIARQKRGLLRDMRNALIIKDLVNQDVEFYEKLLVKYEITDIIHCAGISKEKIFLPWSSYYHINVNWTETMGKAFLYSPVTENFVYISSVGVYGTIPYDQPASEFHPYNPDGKYHLSKCLAEKRLIEMQKAINMGSKKIYILRLNTLYGLGDKGVLWKMFFYAKKGYLPVFGNPLTSFCSLNLVFETLIKLLEDSSDEYVFNVSERPFRLLDFLEERILYILGTKFQIFKMPKKYADVFLKVKIPWIVNRIALLSEDKVYNITRLERLLKRQIRPMEYFDSYSNYYRKV